MTTAYGGGINGTIGSIGRIPSSDDVSGISVVVTTQFESNVVSRRLFVRNGTGLKALNISKQQVWKLSLGEYLRDILIVLNRNAQIKRTLVAI